MLVSFLAIFAVGHNAVAQEERGFPIKEEAEGVLPDSVPDLENTDDSRVTPLETNSTEFIRNANNKNWDILILPAKPLPNPNTNVQEDKPKIKEAKSESSFNIFYYLIYKFRTKEGSGD